MGVFRFFGRGVQGRRFVNGPGGEISLVPGVRLRAGAEVEPERALLLDVFVAWVEGVDEGRSAAGGGKFGPFAGGEVREGFHVRCGEMPHEPSLGEKGAGERVRVPGADDLERIEAPVRLEFALRRGS